MSNHLKAIRITDNVFWVGAIDWGLRDFHGYQTSRGTTYNAFLLMAEKITLIDTVKAPFRDEMFSRISSVIDPEKISIIVSNHAEMDHSGCLPDAIERIRPEKVIASSVGVKALKDHFHFLGNITPVTDGEEVCLGNMTLRFIETKMLHWPESMFAYAVEPQLLFSQDAFGMHLATGKTFADELDWSVLEWEMAKYYANILLPYSKMVLKLIDRARSLNLEFKMVLPDHGSVWRKDFDKVVALYEKWALQKSSRKAVIVYDTMWQSTARMSRSIADGLVEKGINVCVMPLSASHRSDVATELLDAGALIVGSPTINGNMFPTVADILTYLKGLRRQNLIGAAFGSYGWGGESVKQVSQFLSDMGVNLVSEGLKVKYVPDEKALVECRSFGLDIGNKLIEATGNIK